MRLKELLQKATWITEAPRGMLIHHYELDHGGQVKGCTFIPPTSQNLGQIERNLHDFIQDHIDKPIDFLKTESEKIARSYDPCISCAVHLVVSEGTGRRNHHMETKMTLLKLNAMDSTK
ncbi:MAG: nickel-dependent hydrogenase large subunit [Thermodesulfovibrionales bacterium]|jgi:coenzyme F420-reducing hydrogenase alpha subunit